MSAENNRFKALIIDFDDTLSLTEEGCFVLENEILTQLGQTAMDRKIHRETWGMKLGDAIGLRSPGVDTNAFTELFPKVHAEFIKAGKVDVIPFENIEALDRIKSMGMMSFILTTRTHAELNHLLAPHHALASRIRKFYHWDNMEYHKPDPRAFAQIEARHGLAPKDCVYIGDSPGDAASSTGAGLTFVACLESGLRTKEDFAAYPVAGFVDRFADIVDFLAA